MPRIYCFKHLAFYHAIFYKHSGIWLYLWIFWYDPNHVSFLSSFPYSKTFNAFFTFSPKLWHPVLPFLSFFSLSLSLVKSESAGFFSDALLHSICSAHSLPFFSFPLPAALSQRGYIPHFVLTLVSCKCSRCSAWTATSSVIQLLGKFAKQLFITSASFVWYMLVELAALVGGPQTNSGGVWAGNFYCSFPKVYKMPRWE